MNRRYTLGVIAALMLAGCGGSQVAPAGRAPQALATATHGSSWVLPEAKSEDLLYVTSPNDSAVFIYAYPKDKFVGEITGFTKDPYGACVDKLGDVYVLETTVPTIVEYAHGDNTPLRTMFVPEGDEPLACAVDPSSGDLAVTNADNVTESRRHGNSTILLYKHAKGKPKLIYDRGFGLGAGAVGFDVYDSAGNLFVDGDGDQIRLDELPKGSSNLENIAVSGTLIYQPGGMQWSGKYLSIIDSECGQQRTSCDFQLQVSSSGATIGNSISLSGSVQVYQPWISGHTLIAPDIYRQCGGSQGGCVDLYQYPKGGRPTAPFPVATAFSAVVSKAR
jgi:DNA-binding beta-propeller fold protein YncE